MAIGAASRSRLGDSERVVGIVKLTVAHMLLATEMDIVRVYDATMSGAYLFELKKATSLRSAVIFARQRLLRDAAAKGYNVFLTEG